jgi:hypothetical protein
MRWHERTLSSRLDPAIRWRGHEGLQRAGAVALAAAAERLLSVQLPDLPEGAVQVSKAP